ncbi:major facilitator superfamily domain-containing protein [Apiospora phragmitis]|uniref:Major facilitator superfamily domain-containing protein n=1 Tax=Apiospora phragmitis TaxID=2905665 RepID=A0ABR1TAL7_9PEZI
MGRMSLSSAVLRPLSIDNPAFRSRPEVIESPPSPSRHASIDGHETPKDSGSINEEKELATVTEQGQRSEVSSLNEPEKPEPVKPEKAYHIFPKGYKRLLIAIIGVAGLFSGLSSNIYFPATKIIADDLHISLVDVSLTITSYLVVQGISPLFWGSLSDTIGRRPIYIASFIVYLSANIALSFSPNFAVVLLFRGLQSAGSASTVSIGNGVIQDIAHPSEKGAYISFYQAIRNFSIAVGPVLGGVLAERLGFRSIFIFLVILSGTVFVMILLLLPETLRTIAGDGSIRLKGIYMPFYERFVKAPPGVHDQEDDSLQRKKVSVASFLAPLRLLGQPDVLLHLIFGGMIYAVWTMVTSSTTSIFKGHFGLDELEIGLAFLPNGIGTIAGSSLVGYLMTCDFRAAEVAYNVAHGQPEDQKLPAKNMPVDFPIERTRLRHLPWIAGLFVASTAAYGLSLLTDADPDPDTPLDWRIVLPLITQFFVAATSNAVFALNQSLVSDLCPGQGAGSTAINNLVRCSLGAIGVAVVEMMVSGFGPVATYVGLALFIAVVATPFAVVNWFYGPGWRMARVERERAMKEEQIV